MPTTVPTSAPATAPATASRRVRGLRRALFVRSTPTRCLLALLTAVLSGLLAIPAGAAGSAVTITFVPVPAVSFAVAPGTGSAVGSTLVMWGTGEATAAVDLVEPTVRLVFSARGDACEGSPELDVRVDDVSVFDSPIAGTGVYAVRGYWAAGRHTLSFEFGNDRRSNSCDRNVKIGSVGMWTNGPGGPSSYVEQKLDLAAVDFAPASAGIGTATAARLHSNGSFTGSLDSRAAKRFTVALTARACAGLPRFRLTIDDVVITERQVPAASMRGPNSTQRVYSVDRYWADGVHEVKVSFLNDRRTASCDRSMSVVSAYFSGTV